MAVAKTTDAEVEASVVFLKWFTQPENNIAFAVGSGYLPVTHAANDMDAIHSSGLTLTGNMENVLMEAVDAVNTNELYTTKAFEGGTDARSKLNYSMSACHGRPRHGGRASRSRRECGRGRGGIPDG